MTVAVQAPAGKELQNRAVVIKVVVSKTSSPKLLAKKPCNKAISHVDDLTANRSSCQDAK